MLVGKENTHQTYPGNDDIKAMLVAHFHQNIVRPSVLLSEEKLTQDIGLM